MLRWVLRAIFIVMVGSLLIFGFAADGPFDFSKSETFTLDRALAVAGCIVTIVLGLAVDLFVGKKSLAALAGVFFGLAVGLFIGWVFSVLVELIYEIFNISDPSSGLYIVKDGIKWMIYVLCCYLAIVFIMQTKDDFRFIIPYVEFTKQTKGGNPLLLDTSAVIDGRIVDVAATGLLLGAPLVIPRFVLNELQMVADSADRLKRVRGRRGFDMLKKMQNDESLDLEITEIDIPARDRSEGVDHQLVVAAAKLKGKIITTDYNLNKLAGLAGVEVLNINDLANAIKPVMLPGETMLVKVVKQGDQADQGVGYMDDGTMVVVEQGRDLIGREVTIAVTSMLQTSAGRMIFGRLDDDSGPRQNNGGGRSGGRGSSRGGRQGR